MRLIRSSRANAHMRRQDIPTDGKNGPAAIEHHPSVAGDSRLTEAVSQLNGYIQSIHRNIEFSVDAKINCVVVKVSNLETGEIIREIPAEEVLDMSRYLVKRRDWLSGMGL